uniref:Uncharacterized protein n=1 Tax=Eutreptiella gymnastica TaxID=73025 RepID=A0A7S1J9J3_9EUGL
MLNVIEVIGVCIQLSCFSRMCLCLGECELFLPMLGSIGNEARAPVAHNLFRVVSVVVENYVSSNNDTPNVARIKDRHCGVIDLGDVIVEVWVFVLVTLACFLLRMSGSG